MKSDLTRRLLGGIPFFYFFKSNLKKRRFPLSITRFSVNVIAQAENRESESLIRDLKEEIELLKSDKSRATSLTNSPIPASSNFKLMSPSSHLNTTQNHTNNANVVFSPKNLTKNLLNNNDEMEEVNISVTVLNPSLATRDSKSLQERAVMKRPDADHREPVVKLNLNDLKERPVRTSFNEASLEMSPTKKRDETNTRPKQIQKHHQKKQNHLKHQQEKQTNQVLKFNANRHYPSENEGPVRKKKKMEISIDDVDNTAVAIL